MKIKTFLLALILFFLTSSLANAMLEPTPHLIVYKTKANYNDLVPITLSDDNSEMISFADPTDIYRRNPDTGKKELPYPIKLNQGYLLRYGLSSNAAFLDVTYEEYSSLDSASYKKFISLDMVKNKDYDPFLEMYDCGEWQSKDDIERINNFINQGKLKKECVSRLKTNIASQTNIASKPGQLYLIYWVIGIMVVVVLCLFFKKRKK